MPIKTIKLKRGVLLYDGHGAWRRNGKLLDDNQRRNYKFYDRGYWKGLDMNGGTPVLDLDKNGNRNKTKYISNQNEYWENAPIISHAVDSIAKTKRINPALLKNRLNHEGFTDEMIKRNNRIYLEHINPLLKNSDENIKNEGETLRVQPSSRTNNNYNALNGTGYVYGTKHFGLDTTGYNITQGNIIPDDNTVYDLVLSNHGDNMGVNGRTAKDNISLMADQLNHYRRMAKTNHPNFNNRMLDIYTNGMYNAGPYTKYFKNHPDGGKYKFDEAGRSGYKYGGNSRKKCWIGAAIGAASSIIGGLLGNSAKKKQARLEQENINRQNALAYANDISSAMNNDLGEQEMYDRIMYQFGGNGRKQAKYGCRKRC